MKFYKQFLLVLLLLVQGCDGLQDTETPLEPGVINLGNATITGDANNVFELGEIRNTKAFNFNLSNRGDLYLFDITIESSNAAFVAEPASISSIAPQSNLPLSQGLVITAVHGTSISDLGPAGLMPMGRNETTLSINASTRNRRGDTLRVKLQAVLEVEAKVVDIEVHDTNGIVALDSPHATLFQGSTSSVIYSVMDGPLQIINSGNTDLSISIAKRISFSPNVFETSDLELLVGEETQVDRVAAQIFLRIDGHDTISDQNILPIKNDGLIYLGFFP